MVSRHACGLLAGAAIVLSSISATANAQYQKSITIDRWGRGGDALPYKDVHLSIDLGAPSNVQSAFSGDNGQTEYAGVFGGNEPATGQPWDVFCTDLDQNIYIGANYNFNIYSNLLAAPIRTGVPANESAPLISVDQKMLIKLLIGHCLGLGNSMGMDPPGYQFLTGMYESSSWRRYDAVNNPTGMTNEKAGAAQLLIWEIVHEKWDYSTRTKPLDQFDPAWVAANQSNVDLATGWLQWSNYGGTDIYGKSVDDYFTGLKNCAFNTYYQTVPEATTAILGGIAVWPFLTARRRRPLHA